MINLLNLFQKKKKKKIVPKKKSCKDAYPVHRLGCELATRLRTVSTPLGGSRALTRETVINNRIGVAYCARLPIAGPPSPPPYSRISRAIKHVRPFTGPCTFACVRASVHLLSRRRVGTCSVARISILVPVAIARLTTWGRPSPRR